MTKAREWTYTVKGFAPFPVDMLRYDGCFPRTSEDSVAIGTALAGRTDPRRVFEIRLHSPYHEPTIGRWQSFGWIVGEVSRY